MKPHIRHARDGSTIIPAWMLELYTAKERRNWERPRSLIKIRRLRPTQPECKRRATRAEREALQGKGWTREEWQQLLEHYGRKCLRCGGTDRLVPDHVTPLKKDGAHELVNIQPLCWKCNLWKGLRVIDFRSALC